MSDPRGIVHTALAIREMVDSLLFQLGAQEVPASAATASSTADCAHPRNQRRQRAAFGQTGEHWTCGVCGHMHDDPEPGSEGTVSVDGR